MAINNKLQNDESLQVCFSPNGKLIDTEKQKINKDNTGIISKTIKDLTKEEKNKTIAEKQAEIVRLQEIINAPKKITKLQDEIKILHT